MRNLEEELQKLIEFAKKDNNIRALVLQGSFVNDDIEIDEFSDLDPLFYVKDVSKFTEENTWKKHFGKPISFFHDEQLYHDGHKWYTRLTLYEDGFKIDFGFQSVELAEYANEMKLYKIYLDKDNIVPLPNVKDHRKFYVTKPTEEEVLDRLNAFFFDSSYVVKSLIREELFFEKYMESVLQMKLRKLIEWYIGIRNNFKVNTGLYGRYFKRYLTEEEWDMLLQTYPNGQVATCSDALIASYELVHYLGTFIAKALDFHYPKAHEQAMLQYCKSHLDKYIYGRQEKVR